jgi:hypothetical protein
VHSLSLGSETFENYACIVDVKRIKGFASVARSPREIRIKRVCICECVRVCL